MIARPLFVFAAAMLLAAAAWAQKPVVNMFNWPGYVPAPVIKAFEKQDNINVLYNTFESNEVLDAALRDNKPLYDVVAPRAKPFLANQIADHLYQPLDRSRLPNYGNLDPKILKLLAVHDPDNQYAVPWMWGTVGIGFNVDKVKRLLPDMPPDSLRLIFDPAIVSRFKDCGVMVLDSPAETIPAALRYLGLDPDSKNDVDLAKAADAWRAVRPFIRRFAVAEFTDQLAQGNVCLAFGYSGDIDAARRRAAETKGRARITLGYAIPREGAMVWIDALAIPGNAPHAENAYKLIDFLLQPQQAAESAERVGYATANKAAQALLTGDAAKKQMLYPPPEVMDKLYVTTPADRRYEQQRAHSWNSIKGGK